MIEPHARFLYDGAVRCAGFRSGCRDLRGHVVRCERHRRRSGKVMDRRVHLFEQGGYLAERLAVIGRGLARSEEHTSELQSLMRISYAVFCLKKKKRTHTITNIMH